MLLHTVRGATCVLYRPYNHDQRAVTYCESMVRFARQQMQQCLWCLNCRVAEDIAYKLS